jgi:serine/threonine protein kinase
MNNDINNEVENEFDNNNENETENENEKDIKIITLPDSKLQIFGPPFSIGQTNNYMLPRTPNLNLASNGLFEPERANFTFSSKIEYLGVGGFSKVYRYRGDLENKAVKKIFADPKYYSKKLTAEDSIKREVFGMQKIKCENSIKVFGVYQNKEKNTYYLLMELCDGNIENYVKDRGYPLNIYEILELLNQLNNAFYLLEINNIIHRDIKPSNILYKEDKNIDPHNKRINKKLFEGKKLTFKIGDYGVCIPLYDKNYSKSQFMGTLDFMAPEIYEMKCEKEHPIYTKKIDLFSLGQSILCLMGFIKKASALNSSMIEDLRQSCTLFKGNRKEKMLADLIFNYLLVVDPEKRADWMKYFNHPLFDDNNVCNQVKDENIKRIEKKYIKRNSMDNSKEEIPKNIKLYNVSKEQKEKEKDIENNENLDKKGDKNNFQKGKNSALKYGIIKNIENKEKDSNNKNINFYNKNKVISDISDKIIIKKNVENKTLNKKNSNNSASNIKNENNLTSIYSAKNLTYKIN